MHEQERVPRRKTEDRIPDLASGAMLREAAISGDLVGAQKLWLGAVELPPGAVSAVHHHGDSESAIYDLRSWSLLRW